MIHVGIGPALFRSPRRLVDVFGKRRGMVKTIVQETETRRLAPEKV
jgi:hypothetical protein